MGARRRVQAVASLGTMLEATDTMNEMAWRGLHARRLREEEPPAANGLPHSAEARTWGWQ